MKAGEAASKQAESLKADLVDAQKKLKASELQVKAVAQSFSVKEKQVAACTDMLSKAEQVLRTCVELHHYTGPGRRESPLALALSDTTHKVSSFLKTIQAQNKQDKN